MGSHETSNGGPVPIIFRREILMKTTRLVSISVLFLCGVFGFPRIAEAQCNHTELGGGITCVLAATATSKGADVTVGPITSSGNLEVITVHKYHAMGASLTACNLTDSKNANPTMISIVSGGTGTASTEIWYVGNPITGAGHTIHCAAGEARMTVAFYQTSVQLGPDLNQQTSGPRNRTSVMVPSLKPTASPALIVGACASWAKATPTMTNVTPVATGFGSDAAGLYGHTVQSTAAAFQSTCTSNRDGGLGIAAMTAAFVPTDCMGASPHWMAATPKQTTVEECLRYMQAGDTLTIGPGTAMWDKQLDWEAPPNTTIQGQTVCTGSGRPGAPEGPL